jgi:chromosome segregation ATPase
VTSTGQGQGLNDTPERNRLPGGSGRQNDHSISDIHARLDRAREERAGLRIEIAKLRTDEETLKKEVDHLRERVHNLASKMEPLIVARELHATKIERLEDGRSGNATEIALIKEQIKPVDEFRKLIVELREELRVFKARLAVLASAPGVLVAALEIYRLAQGK